MSADERAEFEGALGDELGRADSDEPIRSSGSLTAIIVAGGSSQRMGFDKLLAPLNGKPVFAHSIIAFEQTASVSDIILVARAERIAEYERVIEFEKFAKVSAVIPGGARRQDSVRFGIERLSRPGEFIAVHDAARPLVRPELIERALQAARSHGAAAVAVRVIDTLKRADDHSFVIGGVERRNLFAMQTPQIFRRALLESAYAALLESGIEVTDEVSAVERLGENIMIVTNDEPNFKITYPADLALAGFVLRQRSP
jgi:2-C-methyl-D-erythritol 4-phosphate cytidylyltransferase